MRSFGTGTAVRTVSSPLWIDGPAGRLEAVLSPPTSNTVAGLAIICHPHPLHGGNFNNKVVVTLARACNDLGLAALRFNFRGVGGSAGQFAQGDGETEDARAALAWGQVYFPGQPMWLAGFSFGGYVAYRVACEGGVACLITVAPAVTWFAASGGGSPACPWLVVQGAADEIVDPRAVTAWAAGMRPVPEVIMLPEVGHFFHGQLTALRSAVMRAAVSQIGS